MTTRSSLYASTWQVEAQWIGFTEEFNEWTGFGALHNLEGAIEEAATTAQNVLQPANWRFRIVNRTTKEIIPWEIFA